MKGEYYTIYRGVNVNFDIWKRKRQTWADEAQESRVNIRSYKREIAGMMRDRMRSEVERRPQAG
jgi:hypothetical protein